MDDRTGNPLFALKRGGHAFQSRFSREHKHFILEEEENPDRTWKPVVCPQRGAKQFVIEDDETESELSLRSRSFSNRVNDQAEDSENHSVIWKMFMYETLESAVFMGKNYLENRHSITSKQDLTMKQMFDISEKLVSEQDDIYGVKTIDWENSSWKYLSLTGDEQVISLQRTKFYIFSDCVLCHGKMNESLLSNIAWEEGLEWFKKVTGIQNVGQN